MRVAAVVFVVAACVAAFGAGTGDTALQQLAGMVTMVALAVCAALAGRSVPGKLRLALVAFSLLLAASAVVTLLADRLPVPDLPIDPIGGCPTATPEATGYWQDQLAYARRAEFLRFFALACAFQAVRMLPRPPHPRSRLRRLILALPLIPYAAIGLYPFLSASDVAALRGPTAPGVLTLAAAVAIAAVAPTRLGERPAHSLPLVAGVILTVLPAIAAVGTLASAYGQIPQPPGPGVPALCFTAVTVSPPVAVDFYLIGITALFLAGPALFAWSVLRTWRVSEPADPEPAAR
ncbi:hypothetical protein KOI35_10475 [Actinoplanes bogorensis]|uniref:Uncharacterized protein n=1 Tax=Paractinoplanes bogorensis TaxID=1610840 RepID=A0ABS5YKB0_9ACTN|nr:hypothetical protein [Actinoplanes bogorensis]MBU2663914.1 hypothetical protein [Actinoplanes bogorensis]